MTRCIAASLMPWKRNLVLDVAWRTVDMIFQEGHLKDFCGSLFFERSIKGGKNMIRSIDNVFK